MKLLMKNSVKLLLVISVLKLYLFILTTHFNLGCRDPKVGQILKDVIQTDYFRVSVVDDVEAVEVCGALKVCLLIVINLNYIGIYVKTFSCVFRILWLSELVLLMV